MTTWKKIINEEKNKSYFQNLETFLEKEYENKTIYPKKTDLFRCFSLTPYSKVKVVIIGQDPYHQKDQANGLCFSVFKDIKIPPSLRNIFKELKNDLDIDHFNNNDLSGWAKQGVLLMNRVFSVEDSKPGSHRSFGWEEFSDNIIKKLNQRQDPIIFLLWGNDAKSLKRLITNKNHYILESSHPSPLSAYHSFNGSKPFSKINNILKELNKKEIDWSF